jgi:hypothetical protein
MDAREGDFAVESACTLPPGRPVEALTSDGHVVSFWPRPEGRLRFAWDGHAAMPTFDGLVDRRDKSPLIVPSADGAHLAYVGIRDGQQFVGRDAGEDPPFESISRSVPPTFSPDGRHLVYGAGTPEAYHLVLDGQIIGTHPLAPVQAVLSSDGSRLAFVELRPRDGDPDEYEVRVVLDQRPGPWMAGMRNDRGVMQFSPDGRRFAYREHSDDLQVRWVVDGVPQQWATDPVHLRDVVHRLKTRVAVVGEPVAAAFSPDSRRFAYFADVPEKGVAMVEDGAAGPVVKAIGWPVFSPDSLHLAHTAWAFDGRLGIVLDGVLGPTWAAKFAGLPAFSADGRHVAFVLGREEGGFLRKRSVATLVVDGQVVTELPADDLSGSPVFSPDGAHVAWWVLQGQRRRLMVDGDPIDGVGNVESVPVYTAAGRLVCASRTNDGVSTTVMVDGRAGPAAEGVATPASALRLFGGDLAPDPDVPFAVSPDGEHVAWMGLFAGAWHPVLDDRVGPAFSSPLAWSFGADGHPIWYAQRDDVVHRVTA